MSPALFSASLEIASNRFRTHGPRTRLYEILTSAAEPRIRSGTDIASSARCGSAVPRYRDLPLWMLDMPNFTCQISKICATRRSMSNKFVRLARGLAE